LNVYVLVCMQPLWPSVVEQNVMIVMIVILKRFLREDLERMT